MSRFVLRPRHDQCISPCKKTPLAGLNSRGMNREQILELHRIAKAYIDAGFKVRPMRQTKGPDGKKDMEVLAKRDGCLKKSFRELNGYLARHPLIVVLDCDSEAETERVRKAIADGKLPSTPVAVRSHRGVHFYYKGDITPTKIGEKIDVISKGSDIVIAGSWHPLKEDIYEATSLDFHSLPTIEDEDLDCLRRKEAPSEEEAPSLVDTASLSPIGQRKARSSMAGRTDKNSQIFWWLKRAYESNAPATFDGFLAMGLAKNKQGYVGHSNVLGDSDVKSVCRSVWRWYQDPKRTKNMRAVWGGIQSNAAMRRKAEPNRLEALRLREEEHLSIRIIAKRIGYSKSQVQRWISAALDEPDTHGSDTPTKNPPYMYTGHFNKSHVPAAQSPAHGTTRTDGGGIHSEHQAEEEAEVQGMREIEGEQAGHFGYLCVRCHAREHDGRRDMQSQDHPTQQRGRSQAEALVAAARHRSLHGSGNGCRGRHLAAGAGRVVREGC